MAEVRVPPGGGGDPPHRLSFSAYGKASRAGAEGLLLPSAAPVPPGAPSGGRLGLGATSGGAVAARADDRCVALGAALPVFPRFDRTVCTSHPGNGRCPPGCGRRCGPEMASYLRLAIFCARPSQQSQELTLTPGRAFHTKCYYCYLNMPLGGKCYCCCPNIPLGRAGPADRERGSCRPSSVSRSGASAALLWCFVNATFVHYL